MDLAAFLLDRCYFDNYSWGDDKALENQQIAPLLVFPYEVLPGIVWKGVKD